ncbi:MAG: hypothetical protein OEV42_11160 [Deltaproteobacteria bacterium]|nr:hypothetical protein [Deltaproteobacteria bacterium]
MEEEYTVEVKGGKTLLPFSIMRAIFALVLLVLSLASYLIGILLTLTIIGALVGIPIIISTYAIDALALMMLINMREKVYTLKCPVCERKRWVMPAIKAFFYCKSCASRVNVSIEEDE